MSTANRETSEFIRRWERAEQRLDAARREVSAAQCELANATNALGKRLDPGDMADGETIAIWMRVGTGDREDLLAIKKRGESDYSVSIRTRRFPIQTAASSQAESEMPAAPEVVE